MSTARLKRKVELADEGQYGNLTESFVSVGTALPALTDSKKDKNEGKPAWEQEVYDEQGRCAYSSVGCVSSRRLTLGWCSCLQPTLPRRLHRWLLGRILQLGRFERRYAAFTSTGEC